MGRSIRRVACATGIAIALGVVVTSTAQAKGAESVTVYGPGVGTVTLRYTPRPGDVDLEDVSVQSRIYDIFRDSADQAATHAREPGDLGPRYVLTYDFFNEAVTQEVYPLAPGGPEIYFPPGQTLYDMRLITGWVSAPPELRETLVRLGAPARLPSGRAAPTASPDVALSAGAMSAGVDDATSSGWWLIAVAGAAGLGCLGGYGLATVRRRT